MARPPRSPTLHLLTAFALVYLAVRLGQLAGTDPTVAVALAAPLEARPWTVATSPYTHLTLQHLAVNALALAIVGFPLERSATTVRFHAFFLGVGAASGETQVVVGGLFGEASGVVGASGAILGMVGYVAAANPATLFVLGRVEVRRRTKLVVLGLVAAGVVVVTGGPRVAVVAHAAGFVLGVVAGRYRVLRAREA